MTTQLLNGTVVAKAITDQLKQDIPTLKTHTDATPGLAVILVGDNPASKAYVGMKKKKCAELGINSYEHLLSADDGEAALIKLIKDLNEDPKVDGILLQLPLPKGFDEDKMLGLISPDKDVDGFHPENVGKLLLGLDCFRSCTPYGVIKILEHYNISTEGQHVVIIGRSNIVGKPLGAMLIQRDQNATVTICHSRTKNLPEITRQADIVIAAIGKAQFVTADMVKDGAIVIDVGINKIDAPETERGYKLVGDVDFDTVEEKSAAITPVPGGVGPMTIAMLMTNTIQSFRNRHA